MVQLDQSGSTNQTFTINYIDKNEAIFLLGLLKPTPCTHCVDFFKGCRSGQTMQETVMMTDNDYVERQVQGTEEYLCGKLRNIISLSKAEEQELSNKFEKEFNNRISLLTKKGDDDKYVLIHDKDEFNSMLKSVEKQMIDKIQNDVSQVNQHNMVVVKQMQEKLIEQDYVISEMRNTIRNLKRKAKNDNN